MANEKILPQLAIALTDKCNYKCHYCRPSGSSINKCDKNLPLEEVVRLLKIGYQKGFRVFRLTGGEPTLRQDLMEIIEAINNFGDDIKILLGTNGSLLGGYVENIKKYPNVKFFIGLDIIAKDREGFPKHLTPELREAISELSKTNFVRINMLVLNSNKEQVKDVIEFCDSLKIDLKLQDLYYCEEIIDPALNSKEFFSKEYHNLNSLTPELTNMSSKISQYPKKRADCGIPMKNFKVDNTNIIIKDSFKGSSYHSKCKSCYMYPCLHGIYCPIIASDGTIQISNCINTKFHEKVAYQTEEDIGKAFDKIISIINESKFETLDESCLNTNKEVQRIDLLGEIN